MKKAMMGLAAWVVFLGCTMGVRGEAVIGEKAPDFTLRDIHGKDHRLSNYAGTFVVLEWINHGCPFVRKFYDAGEMQRLQKEYEEKGVVWLTICSSKPGSQGHYPIETAADELAKHGHQSAAYLLDESGDTGRAYGARVTPHMYVINPDGLLIYRGAIDSIRSTDAADIDKAENYVVSALAAAMAGREVAIPVTTPYGCSVKY